jgi:hypothetical protein
LDETSHGRSAASEEIACVVVQASSPEPIVWRGWRGGPSPNVTDGHPTIAVAGSKTGSMKNSQRYDTEDARQWAITFRLLTLAIALAGLIIGMLAIRG